MSKSIIKESAKEKSIEKKNSLLTLQDKKIDSVSDLNQIAYSKNHENDFNKAETKQELISIRRLKIKNQKSGNQIVKLTPIKIQPDNNLQLVNSNETIEELPTNLTRMVKKLQNATVAKQQNEINSEAYNNSTAKTVYNNAINDGQNYVFYNISAEEFRKSKVGGFIKKIKRVVERNNPINRLFATGEEQLAPEN
ncbi:MAG: hypothetical protein ABI288_05190 [Ginsengibacter sp.]